MKFLDFPLPRNVFIFQTFSLTMANLVLYRYAMKMKVGFYHVDSPVIFCLHFLSAIQDVHAVLTVSVHTSVVMPLEMLHAWTSTFEGLTS